MSKDYEYGWVMPEHKPGRWERFLVWLYRKTVKKPHSDFDITFNEAPQLPPGTRIRISRTPTNKETK